MINVLIVDDSAVARLHLKHILESDKDIQVMGMAANGEEAVKFVQESRPDVITMDVVMPKMNGLEATRRIMETYPVPIVIVTASYNPGDVHKSFLALESGAVAVVEKPCGMDSLDFNNAAKNIVQIVKIMSEVKVVRRWARPRPAEIVYAVRPEEVRERLPREIKLIAIGASTGGPPVLQTILSGLRIGFPAPLVIVQHITKGFLTGMVEWLGQSTTLPVHVATQGERLYPGHVYFAPDDFHMEVREEGTITLSRAEPENGIRPSVSHLFRSAIGAFGENMIGVLLTGMGKDGAEELKMIKENGAITIVQDRDSSVVYGMPGEATKLGAATYVLSPDKIAVLLNKLLN